MRTFLTCLLLVTASGFAWANTPRADLVDALSNSHLTVSDAHSLWQAPEQADKAVLQQLKMMEARSDINHSLAASRANQILPRLQGPRAQEAGDAALLLLQKQLDSIDQARHSAGQVAEGVLEQARQNARHIEMRTLETKLLRQRRETLQAQLIESLAYGMEVGFYSMGYHLGQNMADEIWGQSDSNRDLVVTFPGRQDTAAVY